MYMLCMFYILLSQPSKCIWIGYFSVVLLGQTYSLQSAAELGLPNTQTDEGSSSPSSLATLKRKSSNKIHHHTHLLVYFPFSFVVLKGILFCCLHFELCVAMQQMDQRSEKYLVRVQFWCHTQDLKYKGVSLDHLHVSETKIFLASNFKIHHKITTRDNYHTIIDNYEYLRVELSFKLTEHNANKSFNRRFVSLFIFSLLCIVQLVFSFFHIMYR